jgi:hypothetical protein
VQFDGITKLKWQWRGLYFDLYVVLDIFFSRKVIRREIHVTETGDSAKAFAPFEAARLDQQSLFRAPVQDAQVLPGLSRGLRTSPGTPTDRQRSEPELSRWRDKRPAKLYQSAALLPGTG